MKKEEVVKEEDKTIKKTVDKKQTVSKEVIEDVKNDPEEELDGI